MPIKRGEVYVADLSGSIGSEQKGVRPVVIVQNDKLFAAWMLTEILYEKRLINVATIEAIRQKVAEERSKKKPAS